MATDFYESTEDTYNGPGATLYSQHANVTEGAINGGTIFTDYVVKPAVFVQAALGHAASSFWNSGINIANWASKLATGEEAISDDYRTSGRELVTKAYGNAWGEFYDEYQGSIEFTGDVASVFAPGLASFKLMNMASKAGVFGRASKLLGTSEELAASFVPRARQASLSYGQYNNLWKDTYKAYGALAGQAVVQSAGATALTAVMLNDSRMFSDYDMSELSGWKTFAKDTLFGAGLGVVIPLFKARNATKGMIGEFEAEFNRGNEFYAPDPKLDAADNIYSMIVSRSGRAFSDEGMAMQFRAKLGQEVDRLAAGDEELAQRIRPLVQTIAESGNADQISRDVFTGLKDMRRIGGKVKEIPQATKIAPAKLPEDASWQQYVTTEAQEKAKALAARTAPVTQDYKAFLDIKTGISRDVVIPTAGDAGYSVHNQRMFTSGGDELSSLDTGPMRFASFLKKGTRDEFTSLDATKADAMHVMATAIGQNAKLAERNFALKTPLKITEGGKEITHAFAFPADNVFGLTSALEFAKTNGRALLQDGKFVTAEEATVRLRALKDDFAAEGFKRGESVDSLSRKLNAELETGEIWDVNQYSGRTLKENLSPRHAELTYDLQNLPTRAEMQAALTQRQTLEMHTARVAASLFPKLAQYGNVNALPLPSKFSITQANSEGGGSSLLAFGARGQYLSGQSQIEAVGSLNQLMTQNAVKDILPHFDQAGLSLRGDAFELGKWNVIDNYIKSRPAVLELRAKVIKEAGSDGKEVERQAWHLFDTEADAFVQGLPEVNGKVLQQLQTAEVGRRKFAQLNNALVDFYGSGEKIDPTKLYSPPTAGRHFRVVQFRNGARGMINGKSEADVEIRAATAQQAYGDRVRILTKDEVKNEKLAQGIYDPDLAFQTVQANYAMQRQGLASEPLVGLGTQQLDAMSDFYAKATQGLVRRMFAEMYSPQIRQLESFEQRFQQAQQSVKGKDYKMFSLRKAQPYNDAVSTLLNRSTRSGYPLFDEATNFVAGVSANVHENVANFFREAYVNLVPAGGVNKLKAFATSENAKKLNEFAKAYGIENDFTSLDQNLALSRKVSPNVAQEFVSSVNSFFVNNQLTRDVLNQAVNLISFPITTIPELLHLKKQIAEGRVQSQFGLAVPGMEQVKEFSVLRALTNTVKAWGDPKKNKELFDSYLERGIITPDVYDFQMIGDDMRRAIGGVAREGDKAMGVLRKSADQFFNVIPRAISQKTNDFLRFSAAHVVEQGLVDAGITNAKQRALIANQFVKRTQHNFPFGQRPAIFSGPVGSAITLYQTFVFNQVQNLARYAGADDKAALGAFLGINSGVFGLSSNPLFHAVNYHIANRDGDYSTKEGLRETLNDSVGDYLMYGPISAGLNVNFYTRGDITPRTPILLPTQISTIPFVAQTIKASQAFYSSVRKITDAGVPVSDAFLEGVQQSGLSRPAAGLAAAVLGRSVDSSGSKVSDAQVFELATLGRILGGRPFDEAKQMDLNYRLAAYRTADRERTQKYGTRLKSRIASGEEFSAEEFQDALQGYIEAGGSERGFSKFLKGLTEKAGVPLATRLQDKYSNDPDIKPWMDYLQQRSYEDTGIAEDGG